MPSICCDSLVLGGGLAGAAAASALAKRGADVLLCEACPELAQKASGNAYGLIMPYITDRPSNFERAYSAGFTFTRQLLTGELAESRLFRPSGGIQLPSTQRLERLVATQTPLLSPCTVHRVSAQEASQLSGIEVSSAAFYASEAGFVSPRDLVQAMVKHSVKVKTLSCAVALQRSAGLWRTEISNGEVVESQSVVLCAAHESTSLTCAQLLPVEAVRGQTLLLSPTTHSQKLKTLLCFDGYITPESGGLHLAGALYRHQDHRTEALSEDSTEILGRLRRWAPTLFPASTAPQAARACFRTSTFDRLPYVGALPDFSSMRSEAQSYQSGTDLLARVQMRPLPGMYVSLGHGSRGLNSCPMSGEIVARLICNEPLGELSDVAKILSPERLALRILSANVA